MSDINAFIAHAIGQLVGAQQLRMLDRHLWRDLFVSTAVGSKHALELMRSYETRFRVSAQIRETRIVAHALAHVGWPSQDPNVARPLLRSSTMDILLWRGYLYEICICQPPQHTFPMNYVKLERRVCRKCRLNDIGANIRRELLETMRRYGSIRNI